MSSSKGTSTVSLARSGPRSTALFAVSPRTWGVAPGTRHGPPASTPGSVRRHARDTARPLGGSQPGAVGSPQPSRTVVRPPDPARTRASTGRNDRTRTCGLPPKAGALATTLRPVSAPQCLRDHRRADGGNRTRVISLEDWGSTIELRPRTATGFGLLAHVTREGRSATARPAHKPQRLSGPARGQVSRARAAAGHGRRPGCRWRPPAWPRRPRSCSELAIGLADEAVDADADVGPARLDHAIGVEHQRVTGPRRRRRRGSRPEDRPELRSPDPGASCARPPASGAPAGARPSRSGSCRGEVEAERRRMRPVLPGWLIR